MKIQTNINAVINTKEKYNCEYKVTNNGLERNTKKLQMQICANTKKIFSSLVPLKLSLEGLDLLLAVVVHDHAVLTRLLPIQLGK